MPNDDSYRSAPTNGIGLAGFVVSLVALLTAGCLSPVGLVLSFIGLFKRPRGFAVAGVIISMVSMFGGALLLGTVGLAVFVAAIAIGLTNVWTLVEVVQLHGQVVDYHESAGRLPDALDELQGLTSSDLTDRWGTRYFYVVTDGAQGYVIHSAGPDTIINTGDDISFIVRNVDEPARFEMSTGSAGLTAEQVERALGQP